MISFTTSVELIQAMKYKVKRDKIQNLKKLRYNFKKSETRNNNSASNTPKEIKINYNDYNTKCVLYIYFLNLDRMNFKTGTQLSLKSTILTTVLKQLPQKKLSSP